MFPSPVVWTKDDFSKDSDTRTFLLSKVAYQAGYCREFAIIYMEWSGQGLVPEFLREKFRIVLRNKTQSFCSLKHMGI